jgi:hypothetical protein
MKCDGIRDLLAEEQAGTLEGKARAELESHLRECAACREERTSLDRLWTMLAEMPPVGPGAAVRPRFYAMLEGYRQGLDRKLHPTPATSAPRSWPGLGFWRRPAFQFGLAGVLIVASFAGGYLFRGGRNGQAELADLREEVHEMRRMVTMSLLSQQSASERLKGLSWSAQVEQPDPEFLSTLLHTLDYDPNVDVRLSAVDALARFAQDPGVRQGIIKSLARQNSPMVQIALIDLLVQLHEHQSADVLRQLTNDANQNQLVRQRALRGLQIIG